MEELIISIKTMTTLIAKFEFALATLNQEIIEVLKTNCDAVNYAYSVEELDSLKCFSIIYPVVRFDLHKISLAIQIPDILGMVEMPSDASINEIKLGIMRELSLRMNRM